MGDYAVHLLMLPSDEPGEMPTVVAAMDQYTVEIWGGCPDFWVEAKKLYPQAREIVVHVPDDRIVRLFAVPHVRVTDREG
jgi:hypothetical protein